VPRALDYPPVWLIAFLGAGWWAGVALPLSLPGWLQLGGTVAAIFGAALSFIALPRFLSASTTIIPHRTPDALITGGIYRLSRNPIYLGDVLILSGLLLRWEAVIALPLVPAFIWVLRLRFIEPEETRLRAAFGSEFDAYCRRTRRWI
jgi:protein-S-isoprenylcysteine O-methyltransferase Ste14